MTTEDRPDRAALDPSLLCAQTWLALRLAADETGDRAEKMGHVVERKLADLARLGIEQDELEPTVIRSLEPLDPGARIGWVVELYFLDPFAPYQIRTRRRDRREALTSLLEAIGQDVELVERIERTANSARRVHRRVDWRKASMIGVGGAALFGLGGFMFAPLVGTALGGAAGLAGAAATNFGLALLGGGAIAAGGAGMAGGLWLVAGAGATFGAVAGAGGGMIYQLGAAQARQELLKLQVTFKLTVIDSQVGQLKAQEVLTGLNRQLEETRRRLDEERELNDKNAQRVTELEETLEAIESALGWMEGESEG